ncbi:ComEA family DNA-binding protein [Parabacteroides sp. FAFU027]|uniref:ComEA family DNA-binding protein n=1 Tax=Parabacteroides sp. FAFU027 TaxID=2922715 RepID=UPI001FB04819|nr:helix-hairpin-helix domain-containing protein [Parabacteroides sp. FAFU027]
MWKEYFSLSKRERRSIWILFALIAITIAVRFFLFRSSDSYSYDRAGEAAFEREVKAFEASKTREKPVFKHSQYPKFQPQTYPLFDFDPNTADSLSFVHLGLKPFQARMILKYRSKGGKYRKPEDFARVPYLDKTLYAKLLPHIRIDQRLIVVHRDTIVKYKPVVYQKQEKVAEGTHIDLNKADTSELKKVPGIGSGIAHAIINYRTRLGGFYSVGQLREMKQLSPEQVEKFSHFLALNDVSSLHRIPINKSGIERLMSHPYLNFYQAKAIVELRKKKGKLTSLDQFSLYEEFTKQDFERLAHYLDFSQ